MHSPTGLQVGSFAVNWSPADGNQGLSGITLSTAASPSSLLDTDAANGLQLSVQSCPTAWIETGTAKRTSL